MVSANSDLPVDQVEAALRAVSKDPEALSRLAVMAVLTTKIEHNWVSELAHKLYMAGAHVQLEASVGGVSNIDLVVGGDPFEIKRTYWSNALKQNGNMIRTDDWIGKDFRKLRELADDDTRAYVIIAMVTFIDARHTGLAELVRLRDESPDQRRAGREAAIRYYLDFGLYVKASEMRQVDVGIGTVPHGGGSVHFDAIVLRV
jgi:hypothetical protein